MVEALKHVSFKRLGSRIKEEVPPSCTGDFFCPSTALINKCLKWLYHVWGQRCCSDVISALWYVCFLAFWVNMCFIIIRITQTSVSFFVSIFFIPFLMHAAAAAVPALSLFWLHLWPMSTSLPLLPFQDRHISSSSSSRLSPNLPRLLKLFLAAVLLS